MKHTLYTKEGSVIVPGMLLQTTYATDIMFLVVGQIGSGLIVLLLTHSRNTILRTFTTVLSESREFVIICGT